MKKWVSAGCVVVPSMDDMTRTYIAKPEGHWGGYTWVYPKGRIDKGETIKQAALREVYEETGLKVRILSGRGAYLGTGKGSMSITHYFLAVKVGGAARPVDGEIERVELVTWAEAKHKFKSTGNKRGYKITLLAEQAVEGLPRQLATMDACRFEIGEAAAKIIIDRSALPEGAEPETPQQITLAPKITYGDTLRRRG